MRLRYVILAVLAALVLFMSACEPSKNKDEQTRDRNLKGMIDKQPAVGMDYSPTRENMIKWADKWEEQGKLAYVYFFYANGQPAGYFIFEGLPTSYCASLTPPVTTTDNDKENGYSTEGLVTFPAPALDGAYYSGSGCNQFYGYEAGTGNYFEFSEGGSFNYFLSESPLTNLKMNPIGTTTEEDAKKLEDK